MIPARGCRMMAHDAAAIPAVPAWAPMVTDPM